MLPPLPPAPSRPHCHSKGGNLSVVPVNSTKVQHFLCQPPTIPPAHCHGQAQPLPPSNPILGMWASLPAGMGGWANAGKSTLRARGRPMEPSWAGNRGHASCHSRLGSAPVVQVPAPAPGWDWAPSLPLCPSLGPLLAQPSPACASQAFPTLQLAKLGLSPKPSTAHTPIVVPMVHPRVPVERAQLGRENP